MFGKEELDGFVRGGKVALFDMGGNKAFSVFPVLLFGVIPYIGLLFDGGAGNGIFARPEDEEVGGVENCIFERLAVP